LISSDSAITSEVRVIATKTPEMKPRLVVPRVQGVEYSVEHHGEHFYVLTNENATNFKLIRMSQYATTLDEGEVILAEDQEITRNRVSAFEKFLVIYQRHEGLPELEIRPLDKFESPRVVEFDDASYSVWLGTNPEFFTDSFRYGYTSFVQPSATYEINLTTFDRKLLKEKPVRDFDPSLYGTKRVMATASDGVKVPVSMVYRKGIDLHGDNPMVLYGYGAYGSSYDAYFSSNWISLLNRGVMIGIAHIRGGGEFGRRWKNDGKLKKKMNTFTDFIACAEHLIEKGYTSSSKLVIQGESAGGLLIGAVLNMRPKLFKAAVAGVPFVDVVNTMLDETIPLTAIEWEEWGNPNNIEDYETILRYSPYDNVSVKDYPAILVLAGLNDPRVHYWEPAKWTAKLRAHKTDQNVLLLKTNMGAGHGGASGRYGRLKEQAFEFTFMLKELDLLKVGASS